MLRLLPILFFALSIVHFSGCPSASSGDAACISGGDCTTPDPAPCAGCPAEHKEICVAGRCEQRASDSTEIFADINLNRTIAPNVRSVVHVLVDTRMGEGGQIFSCDEAFLGEEPNSTLNVLSAGYKALSGGSYHPAVSLGRAPAGEIAILLLATSDAGGAGSVLAKACILPVTAEGASLEVGLVQLEP